MKKLITLLFAVISINCFSQVQFIGQTKAQIKDYWSTRVSEDYFKEGKWDNTQEEYFMIQKSVGLSDFDATFDVNGKCKYHSMLIKLRDVSVMKARLGKMEYNYNEKLDGYLDAKKKYIWKFIEAAGGNVFLECRINI